VTIPTTPTQRPRSYRGIGLPISAWLVLGFAFVVGAFAVTSALALRGTRHAMAEVVRTQQQFEPLARSVRDLSERAAAFDRAVLAYLRADSDVNRSAVAEAAARFSQSMNDTDEIGLGTAAPSLPSLLSRSGAHQGAGFRLLELQDQRQRATASLDQTYAALHRRVVGAGGSGIVVGDNVISRPSLNELDRAIDLSRSDATKALAYGPVTPVATEGEVLLRRTLKTYREEFARSPGSAWLGLMDEDVAQVIDLRRRVQRLEAAIEEGRAAFAADGEALTAAVHDELEAPAWRGFIAEAAAARAAVEASARSIGSATFKAILLALLALAITAWAITWPVRRMTAGTRRLAGGDLTARVPRGGAKELDELAQAFNHMATELDQSERAVRTYQAQLEQRVEERTLQLRHLAEHDPLTNLPNRRQLLQHLNQSIELAALRGSRIAVMFLDLDNFKSVNDSLGHEFGDRVLTEIGQRMRQITDESGFIARLGGDEFTLVFPYSGDASEVAHRAEMLVDGFKRPLTIDLRDVAVGVSCGVAIFPEHGLDATSLLRAADAALFRAKELGRNRLCFHEPSMLADASNRFRIEQALRKAIKGGDFVLHFQPQVCLGTERANSVEALLRWRRSDTEIVPASEFIQIAEQSGLMLDLNDWVLDSAASAVRNWRDNGWPDARVAVNVSAQQFMAGNFVTSIERLLRRHDLPPEALELELTENMLQTGAITVETLHALRMLGVATALDDFGTGYSSLTSLEQLPLNRVKLDRRLIAEVDHNPRAAAIARSIIVLCRNLGLAITAEGVERHEQLDFLASCGDVSVQGYLVSRPVDARAVVDFVMGSTTSINHLLRTAESGRRPPREGDMNGAVSLLRRLRR
jgi:diguanylate cyclase (GGDEF)-like protein